MNNRVLASDASAVEDKPRPGGWALAGIITGLLLTLFLATLDATIVGTTLPKIMSDLHGLEEYSWVVTAYLLTSTTVVPIIGKLSDQFGRKKFVIAGIVLFLLGSALTGTSQTMLQLILFRGLQGLGAGCLQTIVFTLIADLFPPAERGRWQGVFVSVGALSSILGPAVGGWIADQWSWRWTFYVNIPIGVLALIALSAWLPSTISARSRAPQDLPAVQRIDFTGALFAAAATVCLLLVLTWGGSTYSWGSVQIVGMLIAAGILYLAFFVNEQRVREPLLPLDLFRNQVFAVSALLALTLSMIVYAMIFYLPLFIQGVLGQTASKSGVGLTPFFIPGVVGALLGGQLIAKIGRYHFIAMIGAVILLFGTFLLTRMNVTTGLGTIVVNMILVGLGIGVIQPIYALAAQNSIPLQRMGAGTGAITYLRAMGSLLGTALLGAIVTRAATNGHTTNLSFVARQALAMSLGQIFLVTFGIAIAVCIITLFLKDVQLRKRGERVSIKSSPEPVLASEESNVAKSDG